MLAAPWSRRQPAAQPEPAPEPEPELPGGVLGYAVAVCDGERLAGWTHTTPLTLREAQRELRHWQRRARLEDKGWLSYEVCEVRAMSS